MNIVVKDNRGRDIMRISEKGKLAIARYPDYSEKAKQFLISVYTDVTKGDPEKLREFLDYRSDENEFCV